MDINAASTVTVAAASHALNPPRRFLPEPIEESVRSSRRSGAKEVVGIDAGVEEQNRGPQSGGRQEDKKSRQEDERRSEGAPSVPRRFAPQPIETSVKSSRRKFLPEPSNQPSVKHDLGDSYVDYVIKLAAQTATDRELQDQAMAAYINERPHERIAHYGFDEDDEAAAAAAASPIRIGKLSGEKGVDVRTFRRSSQDDHDWEMQNMRNHHEKLEQMKRDFKHDDDDDFLKMKKAASPPMLGGDLTFPFTISPKMTRCDTDQVPRPRTYESDGDEDDDDDAGGVADTGVWGKGKRLCGRMWNATVNVQSPDTDGLWMGLCQYNDGDDQCRPATPTHSGIQTPAYELTNPFDYTPGRRPGHLSPGCRVGPKLWDAKQIDDEFPDSFISQIYNYLSLGYPCLAWGFDEELSKISRISVEELRKDDGLVDARGYVGVPEGTGDWHQSGGARDEAKTTTCRRWEALRLYVREWARQSPGFRDTAEGRGNTPYYSRLDIQKAEMVLVLERPNNYSYSPLSRDDGSFRLLEILPPAPPPALPYSSALSTATTTPSSSSISIDALIECRLHPAHIERAAGTYAALSYQWGKPGRGMVISLDGQEFRIQRNLWLFLRQLRRYGHRYLWVDAISINQNDLVERGQQVQLMNRIYPSAARVLVWLGEEAEGSDPAFTFLHFVHQRLGSARGQEDEDGDDRGGNSPVEVYTNLFGDDDQTHVWTALQRLCARDYWTRLWIIQEVLLAKELVLFCGERTLSWDAFKYACAGPATVKGFPGMKTSDSVFGPVHSAKMAMSKSQFRELSHQRALQRPRYLRQLIEAYGGAQCMDIRDRIYGLLGLSRDWSGEDGIDIDYSRTALALLVDTLCSSHIKEDASRFGLLLIHVLQLDKEEGCLSGGFSRVFGEALCDNGTAAELVETAAPLVGSNAPWMESPTFGSGSPSSMNRSLTSNTMSMARHTYHTMDIALRRQIATIYPSALGTSRFTTTRGHDSYTHVSIQVGDLIFSMPDTAIGLIYRPSSPKTLRYVGWAIPEAALNQLDPFWVTDAGIDASLRFLTSFSREDLQVNAISDVLNLSVQVSVWDLLFLLSSSPNGYYESEKRRPFLCFGEPDPRFEKRSRTWRH
ncbi:hypothetical protein DV737_g1532, partial [Chaetothyriales sp. CBS 132003]